MVKRVTLLNNWNSTNNLNKQNNNCKDNTVKLQNILAYGRTEIFIHTRQFLETVVFGGAGTKETSCRDWTTYAQNTSEWDVSLAFWVDEKCLHLVFFLDTWPYQNYPDSLLIYLDLGLSVTLHFVTGTGRSLSGSKEHIQLQKLLYLVFVHYRINSRWWGFNAKSICSTFLWNTTCVMNRIILPDSPLYLSFISLP